ncbi:MAG: hypothetical protein QXL61_03805 [Archaeoglobaceae archaeon]
MTRYLDISAFLQILGEYENVLRGENLKELFPDLRIRTEAEPTLSRDTIKR